MNMKISKIVSFVLLFLSSFFAISATSIPIAQSPLQVIIPTHPKVLIGIGNSQSMDGTLSGAIMVGSGTLSSGLSSLQNSSSPIYYTVPLGFNPPVQAANSSGLAPYSVNINGTLYDNSASRLNVAKDGIKAIINTYMQNTDFGLEIYNTTASTLANIWVYYMSVPGANFTFTNTQLAGNRYVTNPCYNYSSASNTVKSNCTSMSSLYGAALSSNQYMMIGASSDDPTINDVLYASNQPGVFVSYSGPNPASPYPPYYSLSNYKSGSVFINYLKTNPSFGNFYSGPTNAGYVPYSPQVMYVSRGFGYYSSQPPTNGKILVPMTTAGDSPTTASINAAISQFTPYLKPETNNPSTTEIKAPASQSPIAGLLTTAKTYLTGLPVTGCKPKLYMILISDGLPTLDLSGASWPPLGSAAGSGYGVTATFNPDGSLNTTNDQALTDAINSLKNLYDAGINTYIIGLGAGVDPNVNPMASKTLTAMAVAGGTLGYYPATSAAALVSNLNSILISVQQGSFATTSAAISSSNLQTNTVEYQTSFTPSDKAYQDWTGNIIAITLDPKTGFPTNTVLWNANTQLDTNSARKIVTWNPAANNGLGGGVPFQWINLSATQQDKLQPNDTLGTNRISYLRGTNTLEQHNGGTFRNRSHALGDIVNSTPAYVGPPNNSYLFNSSGYNDFVNTYASRPPMIYVGANDGMLHAFNATTGREQFAFIPNAVIPNLYNLTSPLYNQSHLFFVDGSPQSADVQYSDGTWHTILVGGEGRGGSSMFAIDVTNPASFSNEDTAAQKILWEFVDSDLGLTFSEPKIGQITTNSTSVLRFAVFFGNGYNNPNNTAVFYALDPQTGKIISRINLCTAVPNVCNPEQPEGLSSVALGQIDGLQGAPITAVYAGDLQGNLWAIDVSNPDPSQWKARLMFQAKDPSGAAQPITTAPLVTLNPSYPRFSGLFVMFGTGQFLTQNDLPNKQIQTVYGIWDKPFSNLVLSRLNLQSQTLQVVTSVQSGFPQSILTSTTNAIAWNNTYGWYTDLPIPGARIMTNSQLINGSFITVVNIPPITTCGNASSIFLHIDYKTGGAYPNLSQLDINVDGKINSSDQYQGKNPVGLFLGTGYGSAPASVGRNSNNNMVQIVTMSNGQQVPLINVNNGTRQTGWWQIQ